MSPPVIRHFRYVRFADVPRRLAQGWMVEDVCPGHHGHYSCLMVWLCACEVPRLSAARKPEELCGDRMSPAI